jgi:hypothetical protein
MGGGSTPLFPRIGLTNSTLPASNALKERKLNDEY